MTWTIKIPASGPKDLEENKWNLLALPVLPGPVSQIQGRTHIGCDSALPHLASRSSALRTPPATPTSAPAAVCIGASPTVKPYRQVLSKIRCPLNLLLLSTLAACPSPASRRTRVCLPMAGPAPAAGPEEGPSARSVGVSPTLTGRPRPPRPGCEKREDCQVWCRHSARGAAPGPLHCSLVSQSPPSVSHPRACVLLSMQRQQSQLTVCWVPPPA